MRGTLLAGQGDDDSGDLEKGRYLGAGLWDLVVEQRAFDQWLKEETS